jgi:hypothetical protein
MVFSLYLLQLEIVRSINMGRDVDVSMVTTPVSNISSCPSLVAHAKRILTGEQHGIEQIENFQRPTYVKRTHDSDGESSVILSRRWNHALTKMTSHHH